MRADEIARCDAMRCAAIQHHTLQCYAMRGERTKEAAGRCRPGRGGRRRAARRGAAGVSVGRQVRQTRLDEGAGLLRCGGKVWMIWQTTAASRVRLRIRRISASSPSARPCSGPYSDSRIANVGSAELGSMIQAGHGKQRPDREIIITQHARPLQLTAVGSADASISSSSSVDIASITAGQRYPP